VIERGGARETLQEAGQDGRVEPEFDAQQIQAQADADRLHVPVCVCVCVCVSDCSVCAMCVQCVCSVYAVCVVFVQCVCSLQCAGCALITVEQVARRLPRNF
jgi:hypothetical protein